MVAMRKLFLAAAMAVALAGCEQLTQLVQPPSAEGGAYLILEIDSAQSDQQHLQGISERMAEALRARQISYLGRGVLDRAARIKLADAADFERAVDAIEAMAASNDPPLSVSRTTDDFIEARFSSEAQAARDAALAAQVAEILRRRLDSRDFSVRVENDGRVAVHASTRIARPNQVRERLGLMTPAGFHLVNDDLAAEVVEGANLPAGYILAQPYPGTDARAETIAEEATLSVAHIVSINPAIDENSQMWVLAIRFDPEGTRIFCRLTREHTGARFALVVDGKVVAAPTINEPICAGSAQITGGFTGRTATDMATMIASGALPAPVIVVEEGVGARR